MTPKNYGLLCLVLSTLTACGAPDDGGTVDERVDALLLELETQYQLDCDCWWQVAETDAQCRRAREWLPSARQCVADALASNSETADSWLSCRMPVEKNYTDCVYTRLQCGEEGEELTHPEECVHDWTIGVQNCDDIAPAIARALDRCDVR